LKREKGGDVDHAPPRKRKQPSPQKGGGGEEKRLILLKEKNSPKSKFSDFTRKSGPEKKTTSRPPIKPRGKGKRKRRGSGEFLGKKKGGNSPPAQKPDHPRKKDTNGLRQEGGRGGGTPLSLAKKKLIAN